MEKIKTNEDSEKIKIGDKVICIDDGASFNRLRNGDIYTVTEDWDGSPTVRVGNASHMLERFRLVH